jgi:hypothetical protein
MIGAEGEFLKQTCAQFVPEEAQVPKYVLYVEPTAVVKTK